MQSLAEAEPAARRVVIATDGPLPAVEAFAEVISAAELDAPYPAMTVYYDALELNTAVKPAAFRRLLGEAPSVTYLDPDIYVFRPLEAVRAALGEAELALIPHLTRPLLGEAMPNDQAILRSGVYNLGFLAARPEPKVLALIDWWAERCRFDCRVDFAAGLFTDQRWMDLAPGFVDRLAILRDPGLDLAYWSLEGRELARAADGWTVDGRPLSFFHFSGFDPARPDVLSKHQDRIAVAPGSPLAGLLGDYAHRLLANGHAAASATPYAYDRFPSGRPVGKAARAQALAAARAGETFEGLTEAVEARLEGRGGAQREPDPQVWRDPPWRGPAREAMAWLRGVGPDSEPRALTAMLAARADLRARFGSDSGALLAWCLGVEAPARRFAPDLLSDMAIGSFADDRAPLLQASRFANPTATAFKQQLSAEFGLAARARWPEPLVRVLRNKRLAPATGRPAPLIRLFMDIWESRADLQQQFPLRTAFERLRFLRWLAGGGLAEHDVALEHLPVSVRDHPQMRLVRLSVGIARPQPARAGRPAAELWVVEDAGQAREAAADRLVFEAASGRFIGPGGQTAAPGQVELVRFLTAPDLVPADAMALHAHGVGWARAAGVWDPATVAGLTQANVALGFVDEVWGADRDDLFRPARAQAMVAA
jgi:hypothetical protein